MGCSARCCITVPLPSSAHHPPTTGTGRPLTSRQSFALAVAAPCGATDGRRARHHRRTRRRHPVRQGRVLPSVVAAAAAASSSIATADAAAAAAMLPSPARPATAAASPAPPAVLHGRTRRLEGVPFAAPAADCGGAARPALAAAWSLSKRRDRRRLTGRRPTFGAVPRASAATLRRSRPLLRCR